MSVRAPFRRNHNPATHTHTPKTRGVKWEYCCCCAAEGRAVVPSELARTTYATYRSVTCVTTIAIDAVFALQECSFLPSDWRKSNGREKSAPAMTNRRKPVRIIQLHYSLHCAQCLECTQYNKYYYFSNTAIESTGSRSVVSS